MEIGEIVSYNVTHSEYRTGKLKILAKDAKSAAKKYRNYLPEDCFLEDLNLDGDADAMLEITKFNWSGCGSDSPCLDEILANTNGEASILLVWEGGDTQEILTVKDGQVSRCRRD